MAGAPRIPPTRSNSPAPTPAPSRGQQVATGVATTAAASAYQSQASGSSGSTEDQTKQMIDAFIFQNMKTMMDEAQKKLEEAMKKKG